MKRCEAEEWFISVCQKVEYLCPESHSIAYAILMIRLVWYVLHYPDVTDPLLIDTAMRLLQEWLLITDYDSSQISARRLI